MTSRSGATISRKKLLVQKSRRAGDRMQLRYLPPTRRSILQTGVVNPFGPYQRAKCPGSVHAFQTSSRGTSKTRVMTIARWVCAVVRSRFAVMSLLLSLYLIEVFVKPIAADFLYIYV